MQIVSKSKYPKFNLIVLIPTSRKLNQTITCKQTYNFLGYRIPLPKLYTINGCVEHRAFNAIYGSLPFPHQSRNKESKPRPQPQATNHPPTLYEWPIHGVSL